VDYTCGGNVSPNVIAKSAKFDFEWCSCYLFSTNR